VREAPEVLFPDLVENPSYRVLNDLVLQRRDSQRWLPSIPVSGSRLAVTVALDMLRDGFVRTGRLAFPSDLLHILPTSLHPLRLPLDSLSQLCVRYE